MTQICGGLVAAVTSRYTLDAVDTRQRQRLAALGDLVAAIRLPDTAFAQWAGTSVVTDIVVLRRRGRRDGPGDRTWIDTVEIDVDGAPVFVNAWLVNHPELVLGDASLVGRMYAHQTPTWSAPPERLADDLDRAVTDAVAVITAPGMPPVVPHTVSRDPSVDFDAALTGGKEGSIHRSGRGFVRIVDGAEPFTPKPKHQRAELGAAVDLRDALTELLVAEAADASDDVCAPLREQLNHAYDTYRAIAKGPLNRFAWSAAGRDGADGTRRQRRSYPPMGGFRANGPDYPSLLALEDFDDDTQTATRAAIFTRRVIRQRAHVARVSDPADAVAVCLDRHGRLELPVIADLLDSTEDTALTALDDRVFVDPPAGSSSSPTGTCPATSPPSSTPPAPPPTAIPRSRATSTR